jgi:hypothetical protein
VFLVNLFIGAVGIPVAVKVLQVHLLRHRSFASPPCSPGWR